ncbi:MAG: hypothetical protein ACYC9M_11170 [Desulfobulbaceae bacterium]
MTTESLHNIIAVENELHAREQAEQARAEQWLAEQERAVRAESQQHLAALAAEMEASRQQAREGSVRRAAEIVSAAEQNARRLASVSDEILLRILERHLVDMVTGRLP